MHKSSLSNTVSVYEEKKSDELKNELNVNTRRDDNASPLAY